MPISKAGKDFCDWEGVCDAHLLCDQSGRRWFCPNTPDGASPV